jgi:FtsP/CotA-like multicopper oxidase with cupredoxin domain
MKLASGDTLSITYDNNLDGESNVHFHGLIAPANNDGNPLNVVAKGHAKTYTFPVVNDAGMYWYHSHVHKALGKQMHLGLGGLLWVTGGSEIGLGLPNNDLDIHLVLQDKRFNEDDTLTYSPNINEKLSGYHGSAVFVNGKYGPVKSVRTRKYRVRFLNASNARIFNLTLDNDLAFTAIGGDGGLLNNGANVSQIMIGPGERVDTILDFSELSVGSVVTLRSTSFSGAGVEGISGFDIMQFTVDTVEEETWDLPGTLNPVTEPSTTSTRTLNISNGNIDKDALCEDSENIHGINDEIYDPSIVNFTVDAGSAEEWIFDNTNGKEPRSMHVQGAQGVITLREGGRAVIKHWEKGWKDTFLCLPGEKVTVKMQFSSNTGLYVVHAMNLENADTGLMNIFEIV